MFYKAAVDQDYAILLGFTIFIGVATVVGNLLADIAYGLLDPRIRVGPSLMVSIRSLASPTSSPGGRRRLERRAGDPTAPEGGDVTVAPRGSVASHRRRLRAEQAGHRRPRDRRR